MKHLFIIFLLFVYTTSCQKKQEIITDSKSWKKEISHTIFKDSTKIYLTEKQLLDFVKNTKPLEITENLNPPFNSIKFNKVIAYDYNGAAKSYGSILNEENKFIDIVEKQKALSKKQILNLVNFLTDSKTYGGTTAACFDPHLGIVFYDNEKAIFNLDVCLDCNYLISSTEIPAANHKKVKDENGKEIYPLNGFSEIGKNKILNLGKELNFYYGSYDYLKKQAE